MLCFGEFSYSWFGLGEGKLHGKGISLFITDGYLYEGWSQSGIRNGIGRIILESGQMYEGGFLNGKYDGHGIFK